MKTEQNKPQAELKLTHEFNASKQDVFNAFADGAAMGEWWGPVECTNRVISHDFRPGGIFHFSMEYEGNISYARFIFGRIEPYNLLEYTLAFADEQANPVPAPFDMDFPLEIFYQLIFTEENGKTTISLSGLPVDATPEQEDTFRAIDESMQQGFAASFNKLAVYLRK